MDPGEKDKDRGVGSAKRDPRRDRTRMSGTRREAYFTAEIGGVAGVTRGTVYWRFLNKADLFDAKAQRVFDPLEAKVAEG